MLTLLLTPHELILLPILHTFTNLRRFADQVAASSGIQVGRSDAHVTEGIAAIAHSCGNTGARALVVATPELIGIV